MSGKTDCADITVADLAGIGSLLLANEGIASLNSGDFAGLTGLTRLDLRSNELTTLPADIFSGLSALESLRLDRNQLSTLPTGVFSGLTSLTTLNLSSNPLPTSLPASLFADLTATITLPTGATINEIPTTVGTIADITNLVENGSPQTVDVANKFSDTDDTLTYTVESNNTATVTVAVSGSAITITPVAIGTADITVTATDTAGQTVTQTFTISITNTAPTDLCSRTAVVKTVIISEVSGKTDCADITVADLAGIGSLLLANEGIASLNSGDFAGLTGLTRLDLRSNELTTLPADIFSGLSALESLRLDRNQLSTLPSGIFAGLTSLTTLNLSSNPLPTSLPASLFADLPATATITLPTGTTINAAAPTTVGTIANITDLVESGSPQTVNVANKFSDTGDTLTYTVESNNTATVTVAVSGSAITITPVAIGTADITVTATDTAGQTVTQTFTISITNTAPTDLCSRTAVVKTVIISEVSGKTDCADITVADLAGIGSLLLANEGIASLNSGDFAGLTGLTRLDLRSNELTTLPADIFSGLSALESLRLDRNQLSTLPSGIFAGLTSLTTLNLSSNPLPTSLPASLFADVPRNAITLPTGTTINAAVPTTVGTIADIDLVENGSPQTVDVANKFSDTGDTLTYTVESNNTATATVAVSGSAITITPIAIGTADITVTATDTAGQTATQTLMVSVNAQEADPTDLCSRTAAVKNVIVSEVSGKTNCADITTVELAGVTALAFFGSSPFSSLRGSNLKSGDFAGLTGLTRLDLQNNQLSTLPTGVFSGLSALTRLDLQNNQLSTLPTGVFAGLTSLTTLNLSGNSLPTSLPASLFADLPATATITLPTGTTINDIPTTVGTIANITDLVESGSPQTVDVADKFSDTGDTLTYTVESNNTVTVTVAVSGSAITITPVAIGAADITVTATDTAGQTVTQTFTVSITSTAPTDLCSRSQGVRVEIVVEVSGKTRCEDITPTDLAGITRLNFNYFTPSGGRVRDDLKSGDFAGLTGLTQLQLNTHQLTTLPADIFSGLSALTSLRLDDNQLSTLPTGVFSGLTSLTTLNLSGNSLPTSLPASLFADVPRNAITLPTGTTINAAVPTTVGTIANITDLVESGSPQTVNVANKFSDTGDTLTYTVESNNTATATVAVSGNAITITPIAIGTADITVTATDTAGQTATQTLMVSVNAQEADPTDLCSRTAAVKNVIVSEVSGKTNCADITTVELAGVTALAFFGSSPFSSLRGSNLKSGDFAGLTGLTRLDLQNNQLSTLPTGVFSGLSALTRLDLQNNQLSTLPTGVFAGLTSLTTLNLSNNPLPTSLPASLFADLPATATITLPTGTTINDIPTTVGTIANITDLVESGSPQTVDVADKFSDTGDTLTYTVESNNTATVTVAVSGSTVTITPVAAGSATITVTAADTAGQTATQTFVVTVVDTTPVAVPSISISPATVTATVGTAIANITIDSSGGAVDSYSISPTLTAGLTLDTATATISGTPTATAPSRTYTITASNSAGTDTAMVTITVNAAPVVNNPAPTIADVLGNIDLAVNAQSHTLNVANKFSDPDDTLTFSVQSDNTATVSVAVSGSTVTITPIAIGTTTITVTAADTIGQTVTQTFMVTVISSPLPNPTVCMRHPKVQEVIIQNVHGKSACGDITAADLAGINSLVHTGGFNFVPPKRSDFAGLTTLLNLDISGNNNFGGLTTLPADLFQDLPALRNLNLTNNQLSTLPIGIFEGLSLIGLTLGGNPWVSLPTNIFNEMASVSQTTRMSVMGLAPINAALPVASGTIPAQSLARTADPLNLEVATFFSDPDDTLTYTATSATPAIASVAISGSTVTITPVALGTTNIMVTARDTAGQPVTQTFAVTVSGDAAVVAAPNISISPATVTATVGTAIETITITNIGGAVISYNITDSNGQEVTDLAGLVVDAEAGIITGTLNDSVEIGTETYIITATNSGGMDSATITITVNDVPPIISINPATLVATVGTPIDTITITNMGGDVVSHIITDSNGQEVTNLAGLVVDAEAGIISGTLNADADIGTAVYTITVINSGGSDSATITISVIKEALEIDEIITNTQETPTISMQDGVDVFSFDLDENIQHVANITITGVGANSTPTYSLSDHDSGVYDITQGGVLSFKPDYIPNYEMPRDESGDRTGINNQVYKTVVMVSDGTEMDKIEIRVTIQDVNEAPTITSSNTFTVAENSTNGVIVGDITSQDPDIEAPFNSLTYSITSGNTNDAFAISNTGTITVNGDGKIDFETTAIYTLTVTVADGGSPALTGTATITINVNDVNEAPTNTAPVITSQNGEDTFALTLNENIQTVATIIATDVDANTTLSYSLSGHDSGVYDITQGGVLTFKVDYIPNYEMPRDDRNGLRTNGNQGYWTLVTVSDGLLTDEILIKVTIQDVNEAPTLADTTLQISENSINGASVGDITGQDPDAAAPNNSLTYSITGGNTNDAFAISNTGAITVNGDGKIDFETTETYTLTVRVADGGSPALTDTATITINVNDVNEAPTAVGTIANITDLVANGNPQTVDVAGKFNDTDALTFSATSSNPSIASVSGSTTITITPLAAGSATITVTATDTAGQTATQTLMVSVISALDTTPPTITLLGSATLSIALGTAYTDAGATASDDTDGNITASITTTITFAGNTVAAVNTNTAGVYTIAYNVSDTAGNQATPVTRTVTVMPAVTDTTPPTITLLGSATLSIALNTVYTDAGATASDDIDGNITASITTTITSNGNTVAAVNTNTAGVYSIAYNVSDTAGNQATAVTRTVTVMPAVTDTTAPIITLTGDDPQIIEQGAGYTELGATADDGSDVSTDSSAFMDVVGTYTITYTATDGTNPATPVTRTVNVVDTTAPIITLTGDDPQIIEQGAGYTELGASADDGSTVTIDDDAFMDVVGAYIITYTATDGTNPATPVTRTVNVVDTTAPIITLTGDDPQIIEQGAGYTELGATTDDGSTVTIDDDEFMDVVGAYIITYTATDGTNPATPVTRTVNVVDTTAPIITLTGDDPQIIEQGAGYTELGASADDGSTVTIDDDAFMDVVGAYIITYTATDGTNPATPVTRTVNVVDTTAPIITLTGDDPQIIEQGAGYTELGASADDGSTVTIDDDAFMDVVGTYTITYTATDGTNPATPVTRTVNVVDTTAPIITLTGDDPQIIEQGAGYTELGATADDGSTVTIDDDEFMDVVGIYIITYTATDGTNPATPVTRTVNVVDTTAPIITLTGDDPQIIEQGAGYTELGATTDDGSTVTIDDDEFMDVVGAYIITYTATDGTNPATPVTRAVNVVDTTAPIITLTGDDPQIIEQGAGYTELGASADDGSEVSIDDDEFMDVVGAYIITYTATDGTNPATPVTRAVNVVDTTAPIITLTGDDPQIIEQGAGYTELGASADDGSEVSTDSSAFMDVVGTYTITYTATDGTNPATPVTRAVNVVDTTAPIITLTGDDPQTIELGAGYTELGASADDGSTVTIDDDEFMDVVGAYIITYTATDGTNPATPVTRTVNVVDTTAPIITLTGDDPQIIEQGAGYTELGATADDGSEVSTDSSAFMDVVGTYIITYTATDGTNPATPVTRTVNVVDTTAPTVAISTTAQTVNTAAFTLAGTVDAGATVDVLKDGNSIGAASVTGTRWSLAVTLDDGANTFTATATDATDNTSDATDAVIITLDTAPSFSSAAITAIANKSYTYTAGTAIPVLTLPKATGGNGALTYSLSPILPQGLTFDTTRRTISGTPEAETASTSYTYIAADSDTNTAATDTASLTFSITVLSDGLSEEDIQRLNLAIMPRLTQALVASSAASVERRVDIAFTPAAATASYQLDGHQIQFDSETTTTEKLTAGLLQKLAGYTRSHKDGNINWKQLLTNSSFLIPLNSADQTGADQASAANTGLALWGSGDYTRLSENDSDLDWQGDLSSYQLGLDKRLDNLLLGGMLSWSEGDVDYTLEGDEGSYNHKMTSIHPYLAWNNARANLWGSLGYGQGDLTIKQEDNSHSTDTNLLSLAAGIKGQLISGLSLKSDLLLARTDINAAADMNIAKQTIDSQRFRLLLEIAGQYTLASGSIKPMLEIGARYDGGDGNSGTGAVLGAGMRYANLTGLTLEGNLHALVGQGNYKEWGIQALISLDPGTDKLGLAFSLRPGYGYNGSSSDTSALWQQSLPQSNLHNSAVDYSAPDYDARLGARLSYGLLAPSLVGLLTPYSEITLGTINSYRLGIRWQGTARFDLHLFGERRESSGNLEGSRGADQAIQLEGRIHF